jgi:hypothetical protein
VRSILAAEAIPSTTYEEPPPFQRVVEMLARRHTNGEQHNPERESADDIRRPVHAVVYAIETDEEHRAS